MNPFLDRPRPIAERRSWGQRLVLALNLALITTSLGLAGVLSYVGERTSSVNRVELHRSLTEVSETESGARIINILLVGSDSSAALDANDPIQVGRDGERFGDVIIIAHIDERTGDVALLSLPRDLWVPIAGTERSSRINRAFLVGGPAMLIDTIEENFDIPIHHYVNVDFAGFQGLVEAVGSVDVYFETPARDWNVNAQPEPRSQTGFAVDTPGCHALGPEQALAYVRSRYYQVQLPDGSWQTDPTSDLGRIARQQDFLQRLLQKAIDRGARNPLVLATLIDTGIQHVAIDQELTPALLLDLSATYRSFEPGAIQTFTYPSVDSTVGANRVLIPEHDRAEPLRALFGGSSFDDPATIAVRVLYDESLHRDPGEDSADPSDPSDPFDSAVHDPSADDVTGRDLPPVIDAIVDELADVGIDPVVEAATDLDRGFWIRHGADGAQPADVLAAALGEVGRPDASILEVGHLVGREVDLVVGPGATVDIGRQRAEVAAGPERAEVLPTELASSPLDGSGNGTEPAEGSVTEGDELRHGVLSAVPADSAATGADARAQAADQAETIAYFPMRCQ